MKASPAINDTALDGLKMANERMKLAIRTRNKRIKKMEAAALIAYANMQVFVNAQEVLHEELVTINHALLTANHALAFQNVEKEKRAAELLIANEELAFQNVEKERRAAELLIANSELAFQNEEKEKRAAELTHANKELEAFSFVASHDLQEPLRKIQTFASRIIGEDHVLSASSKDYFQRIQSSAHRMQQLIEDLLAYSRTNVTAHKFEQVDLNLMIEEVKADLRETIEQKHAIIEITEICEINTIAFQFRQLMYNLISNALKFADPERQLYISIKSRIMKGNDLNNDKLVANKVYCHISVADTGIGFDPQYKDRIFEVFQKLHGAKEYAGTGIGLAIIKKIIDNHGGLITATGELHKGATFDMYIPVTTTPNSVAVVKA